MLVTWMVSAVCLFAQGGRQTVSGRVVDENGQATEYVQLETPTYESFTMDFDETLNGDDDTM